MRRSPRAAQRFLDRCKCFRVGIVPTNVAEKRKKFVERFFIVNAAAVLLQTVFDARAQLRHIPLLEGDANDGDVQVAAFDQRIQRGDDHFVSEVASDAEERQRVRSDRRFGCCFHRLTRQIGIRYP